MILVDTSVWVDHLCSGDDALAALLNSDQVMMHPFVVGELACGHLNNHTELLSRLQDLPAAPATTDTEALFFIKRQQLMGRGIGYIDAHLLAATALAPSVRLWTRDLRLQIAAAALELAYTAH